MSDDFRLQHSVKTNAGDMLNVRGATPAEFETALAYAETNIARIVALGDLARAVGNAGAAGLTTPAPQQAQASNGWGGAPQAAQPPAPSCAHGAMLYKPAGTNKAGKAYNAFWACTSRDRNAQCQAQWID